MVNVKSTPITSTGSGGSGTPGPPGPPGDDGAPGANAVQPTFSVGTVSALPPEYAPFFNIVGGPVDFVVNVGLPIGYPGTDGTPGSPGAPGTPGTNGTSPNITIGNVTTLPAGSTATASITGTFPNLVLNLGIPTSAVSPATSFVQGTIKLNGDLYSSSGTADDPRINTAVKNPILHTHFEVNAPVPIFMHTNNCEADDFILRPHHYNDGARLVGEGTYAFILNGNTDFYLENGFKLSNLHEFVHTADGTYTMSATDKIHRVRESSLGLDTAPFMLPNSWDSTHTVWLILQQDEVGGRSATIQQRQRVSYGTVIVDSGTANQIKMMKFEYLHPFLGYVNTFSTPWSNAPFPFYPSSTTGNQFLRFIRGSNSSSLAEAYSHMLKTPLNFRKHTYATGLILDVPTSSYPYPTLNCYGSSEFPTVNAAGLYTNDIGARTPVGGVTPTYVTGRPIPIIHEACHHLDAVHFRYHNKFTGEIKYASGDPSFQDLFNTYKKSNDPGIWAGRASEFFAQSAALVLHEYWCNQNSVTFDPGQDSWGKILIFSASDIAAIKSFMLTFLAAYL